MTPSPCPGGERIDLTVERGARTLQLHIRNARLPQLGGSTGIGVLADTVDLHAVLPFEISFRARPGVGGPSAGLAYALAVADMLDRGDDARGRRVAATGTIAPDGSVGPVGGVHEKAIAADAAGARVFLVPVEELAAVDDQQVAVVGVRSLEQALGLLAS